MSFTLQPIRVDTGSDEEGVLVFNKDQKLVAVLTHLSERNEVAPGHWFLEAGFGRLTGTDHPTFADLEKAKDWIEQRFSKELK